MCRDYLPRSLETLAGGSRPVDRAGVLTDAGASAKGRVVVPEIRNGTRAERAARWARREDPTGDTLLEMRASSTRRELARWDP